MYGRLGDISIWPHRVSITENMPDNNRAEFPTTFAFLDGTEIKAEKPDLSVHTAKIMGSMHSMQYFQ